MNLIFAIGQDGKPKLCVGALPGRKRPSLYFWHRSATKRPPISL